MKKKVFHLPQNSISDIVGCVNENKNQTLTKEELLAQLTIHNLREEAAKITAREEAKDAGH